MFLPNHFTDSKGQFSADRSEIQPPKRRNNLVAPTKGFLDDIRIFHFSA
jgi:hypothetical protein